MLQFLLTLSDESNHDKIIYVYDKYHEYMLKYAACKFRDKGRTNYVYDAEDAVQNAFMRITKYIENIDFSREEKDVKNYVFTILNNQICDIMKINQENYEINEELFDENGYSFVEELEIKERYYEVVKAIEKLDERYSITLYLIFYKEMTVNKLAEMMGISAKTVYTRLERGKKLLREALKGARLNG